MNKIQKKLILWKEADLLSNSQYEKILNYENENKVKNLAVYTIITLGGIVISIGFISLIASNWSEINNYLKLGIDFSVLAILSYFIYRNQKTDKKWILEILLVFYFILILASIGLISQIYHTGGKFYQATSFWCLITFPMVIYSTGKATLHIWFASGIYSSVFFLLENIGNFTHEVFTIAWIYSILPVIFLLIFMIPKFFRMEEVNAFGRVALFWSVSGFLSGTVYFSFLREFNYSSLGISKSFFINLIIVNSILSLLCFYLSYLQNRKTSFLLLFGMAAFELMFCSHIFGLGSRFVDSIFFILVWFSAAFIFSTIGSGRLFEFAIVSIGLRFLVAYFQLFSTLALTAFGLIISGILIIVISVLYIKNRERITRWIGGLI